MDTAIRYELLGLLVWTPLAFGAVHTWAYALLQIHVCLLIAIWIIQYLVVLRQSQPGAALSPRLVGTPLALPLVLFLALLMLATTAATRFCSGMAVAQSGGIISPVPPRLARAPCDIVLGAPHHQDCMGSTPGLRRLVFPLCQYAPHA